MARKRHTAEEIVAKLRQVDVLSNGRRSVSSDWRDGNCVLSVALGV